MAGNQRFVATGLATSHADILAYQKKETPADGTSWQVLNFKRWSPLSRYTILIMDVTLWPQRSLSAFILSRWLLFYAVPGVLSLDEAVEVTKSICNSDARAGLFALMPQLHPSIAQTTVIEKKRSLEDKLLGSLGRIDDCVMWFLEDAQSERRQRPLHGHRARRRQKEEESEWPPVSDPV